MTLFYYMAANRELPTGSYGLKKKTMTLMHYVTHVNPAAKDRSPMNFLLEKYPQGDELIEVYETEEDAAGLYVSGPIPISNSLDLFHHPYVYEVYPEGGGFQINDEIKQSEPSYYLTGKKCLTELFDYLNRNMKQGEEFELYSCWAVGNERFSESPKKELDLVIDLSTFSLDKEFDWKSQQFIRVIK